MHRTSLTMFVGAAVVALTTASPRPAAAEEVLEGGEITFELRLPDGNGGFRVPSDIEKQEFFDLAHCICPANEDTTFVVRLDLVNAPSNVNEPVEIWVGPNCDASDGNISERDNRCLQLPTIEDVDTLATQTIDYEISATEFIAPKADVCDETERDQWFWALMDPDGNQEYDHVFNTTVFVDTQSPPIPPDLGADGGEGAVQLSWDTPTSRQEDIFYYQALCARADGTADPDDGFGEIEQRYDLPQQLCPDVFARRAMLQDRQPPAARDVSAHVGVGDGGVKPDAAAGPDGGPVVDGGPTPDGGGSLPPDLENLDPSLLCGEAKGTETSMRIDGLENGTAYHVALLSIDRAGNVSSEYVGAFTPKPVTDFWEDYHDQGGAADGGLCLSTSTFGGGHPLDQALRDFRDGTLARFGFGRVLIEAYYEHVAPLGAWIEGNLLVRAVAIVLLTPVALAAAFWAYTGALIKILVLGALIVLIRRRRRRGRPSRRRSRLALAALGAALLITAAAPAHAQPAYDPYWEQYEEPTVEVGPPVVRWAFEIKLGPYYPAIDDEFGDDGPFQEMYGGDSSIMPILELDRFFLWPAGQLGVAASIGYMGKTAKAYDPDADGDLVIDPETMLPRRSEENTSFRLVPTSLSAVYRYTGVADQVGIPLVPYGKVGLSYYLWWVTKPGGSIAEAPTMECPSPASDECDGDRALGASLGWQGSVGLSFRAEAIDQQAARNLRTEMGIEHAGFFAEVTYASVDGFGADDKLSVGDFTWFGGINFEF